MTRKDTQTLQEIKAASKLIKGIKEFLLKTTSKFKNPKTQEFLQKIATQEDRQLQMLEAEYEEFHEKSHWLPFNEALEQALKPSKVGTGLSEGLTKPGDELEKYPDFLKQIIKMEEKTAKLFEDLAENIKDPVGKDLYLRLAEEKRKSLDQFYREYEEVLSAKLTFKEIW